MLVDHYTAFSNQHDSMTRTAIISTSTLLPESICHVSILKRRRPPPNGHDDIENNMDTWAETLVDHDNE